MIKLFWNTHNQQKRNTNSDDIINFTTDDYGWGLYHKKSSNKWIEEILKKINYQTIKSETEIEKDDTLIIVDSSVEKKVDFYTKLKLISSKIFLFHLGDEAASFNLSSVYNNCNYIWRTFCTNRYFTSNKIKCIPLGYKSGVIFNKNDNKKYKWAFVGTPHKSSRHDLLFQFSEIKPFFCHKTEKFDTKIISVEEMSKVLSLTEFMPCPSGFVHPDSYRLYEALECECIPIVENSYNFFDRFFPNNPFIKINKWSEAKPILNGWDKNQIKKKREECISWWAGYKNTLQEIIKNKIIT